ncbi:hypothetical protein GALMADRAFT_147669 [Galerina marginata CBS 339.88]|uniref:Uncharacterized protein n=1 Tax=Galerina marginata (strain CBS 339.88) TaxID=685588 RepID=A0A067S7N1_GALM3|nr:hypothetical protein GALMADRAFT_147669 [Galerina marginata CBS 339.88]
MEMTITNARRREAKAPAASFIEAYELQEREREELERVVRTGKVLDDHVDLDANLEEAPALEQSPEQESASELWAEQGKKTQYRPPFRFSTRTLIYCHFRNYGPQYEPRVIFNPDAQPRPEEVLNDPFILARVKPRHGFRICIGLDQAVPPYAIVAVDMVFFH